MFPFKSLLNIIVEVLSILFLFLLLLSFSLRQAFLVITLFHSVNYSLFLHRRRCRHRRRRPQHCVI